MRTPAPSNVALPLLAAALLGLTCPSADALGRVAFSESGDFSEAALRSGVQATEEQCAAVANAVWAQTPRSGAECIRYWAAGFGSAPVKRAIVFFHGDVFVGAGKTSKDYLNSSQSSLQAYAEAWSTKLDMPYIFMGRPGTHGSSGDHMQRRRRAESEQLSAALDQLKRRFGVEEWVVAGQSGGGHVTAALITLRSDIVCAVPTSAPSSPRIRWELMGRNKDTTNYADSYEPWQFIVKERMHPALRVLVLGNPQDKNVFWASQTVLADALVRAGVSTQVFEGVGTGPDAHGLKNSAHKLAGWCAKEMDTKTIIEQAARGLHG